jgi:hypothetical protein
MTAHLSGRPSHGYSLFALPPVAGNLQPVFLFQRSMHGTATIASGIGRR